MSLTRNLGNLSNVLTQSGNYALQQTPAQFDNTTKLATTGFVQQALGTLSNAALLVNSNVTLTAAQSGTVLEVATNSTITLPNPVLGLTYIFAQNGSSGYTVAAGASGSIFFNGGTGVSSMTVPGGGALVIWSDGSNWFVTEFSGFGITPAQFDNSTKTATTAWIRQLGLAFSGIIGAPTNLTLSSSTHGGKVVLQTANSVTFTLPLANGMPAGIPFTIGNMGSYTGGTVTITGADRIAAGAAGSITSINLRGGQSVTFYPDPSIGLWYPIMTNAEVGNVSFAGSASGAGYQYLPSGLVIQWGSTTTISSGSSAATNFPISFPNAVFQVALTAQSIANSTSPISGGWQGISTSQFTARNLSASTAQFSFIAIGN